jgi:hypothetical protein
MALKHRSKRIIMYFVGLLYKKKYCSPVSVALLFLHLMILKTSTSKKVLEARQSGKISNTSVSKLLISSNEWIIAGGCSDGRAVA